MRGTPFLCQTLLLNGILLLSFGIGCARSPESIVVRALNRNGTTPKDLVDVIIQWIILPSNMSMNQLIECRDKGGRCLWSSKCELLIEVKILGCNSNANQSLTFTHSRNVYEIQMQDCINGSEIISRRLQRYRRLSVIVLLRSTISRHAIQRECNMAVSKK